MSVWEGILQWVLYCSFNVSLLFDGIGSKATAAEVGVLSGSTTWHWTEFGCQIHQGIARLDSQMFPDIFLEAFREGMVVSDPTSV